MKRKDQMARAGNDDNVLLEHYEEFGPAYCQNILKHRTIGAITQRAHKLDLRTRTNPAEAVRVWIRPPQELRCDIALNNFRAAEPANEDNPLRWAA